MTIIAEIAINNTKEMRPNKKSNFDKLLFLSVFSDTYRKIIEETNKQPIVIIPIKWMVSTNVIVVIVSAFESANCWFRTLAKRDPPIIDILEPYKSSLYIDIVVDNDAIKTDTIKPINNFKNK